jgi:hypothetical protein
MVTMLEDCATEEHRSVAFFWGGGKVTQRKGYPYRHVFCLQWEVFLAQSDSQLNGEILSRTFESRR